MRSILLVNVVLCIAYLARAVPFDVLARAQAAPRLGRRQGPIDWPQPTARAA